MPIYEYYCEKCNKKFEKLSKSTENEANCPDCTEVSVKVFSLTGKKPVFSLSKTKRFVPSEKVKRSKIPGTKRIK